MAKKLDRYRDKRDPARTNEPFGAEPMHSSQATTAGRFVVHQHAARRMHYDLRIEIAGALKSFAVPKGPSLSVTDKHLAVLTEDHPFEYLEFEAVIPAGNYGAGSMILWDTGTIHYLENPAERGLAQGKLDFVLSGFKLRGRFALVETKGKPGDKQRSWLLLKKADAHASADRDIIAEEPESVLSGLRVDELASADARAEQLVQHALQLGAAKGDFAVHDLTPMRCSETGGRLDDPKCLYELKLDGVRLLAERHGESVQLRYRTQRNATALFPEIVRALRALPVQRLVLDGELVAFDARGMPSFAQLAGRIHKQDPREIAAAARLKQVQYLCFDLLAVGDLDLRRLPLQARKQLLAELLPGKGFVRALDHAVGDGRTLFKFCETYDLEGVIAKRADSTYSGGKDRSRHWSKIKHVHSDDFVVVGYTRGHGNRSTLGALEVASYVDGVLTTRGRVGSGFDDAGLRQLQAALDAREIPQCAAQGELMPAPQGRSFVRPELVVSVTHAGFTEDGRLRHPVYRGLRDDVQPRDCIAAPEREREAALTVPDKPAVVRARVKLTNTSKVFWPGEGITKGELCEYYGNIAEPLLPYLRDRPVLMVRYPDGISGKHFFQWNAPQGTPSWVQTQVIHSEDDDRQITYFRVEDRDTLLYLANLAVIPLHILAARFSALDACDFLTIDFDLGGAPFEHAVTLALELRAILDAIALPGFPKTSGQTGLHVLVPVGGAPFTAAVALANLLGRLIHDRHPQLSTLERMRKNRPKAVYIDTGQTGRSRAIVAPYSVRAVAGASVSTPLSWDEVSAGLVPARHTLFSVPERLAARPDPMAELLKTRPDLSQTMARITELVARKPKRS
ncbi:MAG: DNA ligase D [Polyangiales bacterium]